MLSYNEYKLFTKITSLQTSVNYFLLKVLILANNQLSDGNKNN